MNIPNYDNDPLLAELESVMQRMQAAHDRLKRHERWIGRTISEADAPAWTARIEAALNDQTKLAQLRIERDEKLISCEASVLDYECARRAIMHGRSEICGVIRKLIDAMDAMYPDESKDSESARRGSQPWLDTRPKPGLTGLDKKSTTYLLYAQAVLSASALHKKDIEQFERHDRMESMQRQSWKALKRALRTLEETLKKHKEQSIPVEELHYSLRSLYPTEAVTSPKAAGLNLSCKDLRSLWCVDLNDVDFCGIDYKERMPANYKLPELIRRFEEACQAASKVVTEHKEKEKGKVNEKQYAARLVQVLEGEGDYTTANIVPNQAVLRRSYQASRIAIYHAVVAANALRHELVSTLREAVVEARGLNPDEPSMVTTVDVIWAGRISLINCLAADAFVRLRTDWLTEMYAEYSNDLTGGLGAAAVLEACKEESRFYRQFSRSGQ